MQVMTNCLIKAAAAAGLILSAPKTKILRSPDLPNDPICADGVPLEDVESFVYLGSRIEINGSSENEVGVRIAKAEGAFNLLKGNLWALDRVSTQTKRRVYMTSVRPVLLYGCGTWPLTTEDVRRLESFEFFCWRRILGIQRDDRVRNSDVLDLMGQPTSCSVELKKRRLSFLGHVLRMDPYRLPRRALLSDPPASWSRPSGGLRTTWQRAVVQDLSPLNLKQHYESRDVRVRGAPNVAWPRDWKQILCELCVDRSQWMGMIQRVIDAPV